MFDDSPQTGPFELAALPSDADRAANPANLNTPGNEMQNAATRTRYRDAGMSWLALGALLAAWHMEARMERPPVSGSRLAVVRDNGQRYSNQLWVNGGATREKSWIARAAAKAARNVVSVNGVRVEQPEWSSIASVRTARRWLDQH